MISCQSCGVGYIVGTLFCTECGLSLLDARRHGNGKYESAHFLILNNGRKQIVPLSGSESIMIGRADPEVGYWPQLDFSDDGGVEKGVSRQHAAVRMRDNEVLLFDLGSANGTWIDNVRLEPDQPYPLPVSGRVRFGGLDVHVLLE